MAICHDQRQSCVLSKNGAPDCISMLDFRLMRIMADTYRIRGSYRLNQVYELTGHWKGVAMFVGLSDQGVDSAWWEHAARLELSKCTHFGLSDGNIDVYKCFDQVATECYLMAVAKMGIPEGVLAA